ncbi:hypothetical protein BC351_31850 [Paenibacillus ferrarius]|uniref:DNA/RNA helicase n=1 Tax=Paenibacillus ferrarius TaxID=1469647 RepID=A0A1V4HG12_9BACL|nr:helicase-related protein [Paenibacillus ferrarius]OPH54572.1 hypothetical protein BC351_31850 [Paenibacillus ferrarius]
MKVQLYAVCLGQKWEWRITIHTQTDIQYWFEQYAADAGLVVFEPFISFGQGVRLLQKLNSDAFLTARKSGEGIEEMGETALERFRRIAREHVNLNQEAFKKEVIHHGTWKQSMYPRVVLDTGVYTGIVDACSGRSLLIEEVHQLLEEIGLDCGTGEVWRAYLQLAHLNGDLELSSCLEVIEHREWRQGFKNKTSYRCKRCGSSEDRMFWSACVHCGQECPYCEECLTMGRARFCSLLVSGRSALVAPFGGGEDDLRAYIEPWGLSEPQARASLEGLRYISSGDARAHRKVNWLSNTSLKVFGSVRRAEVSVRGRTTASEVVKPLALRKFLIWAVTGAGKTEMIFPFVHHTVARGGRVLIATPRKDVVLELQPRIERAFAGYSVVTLYGGSEQRWEQGQITIATTHQLMRFHRAFDLVIIDEIDAFPYHNNPMLSYAATKVCKPSGVNILLSATPPKAIRKAAERGLLPHVRVPVRFHKHPVPVPHLISVPYLRKSLQAQTLPSSLFGKIAVSIERDAQVFVFVPNIQFVEPTVELLRKMINSRSSGSMIGVEGTSSKDSARTDKVQRFRNREIRLLVTTTILERGVTVPKSDVFILDADSKLFDEAALVQMAGRAGRSKDDPAGKVYFAAKEITYSQKEAIRQIQQMNRMAYKQGYLLRGK